MPDHPAPSGRVVVTGIGVVTPIGTGVETFWANCLAGKNGVRKITLDDVSPFTTQIAAEVPDFEPTDWLDKKEARRIDRVITFAVASARMAMADSGIVLTEELRDNFGVYIGSGIGGLNVMSWLRIAPTTFGIAFQPAPV
jgi:3-oxoacyl-[acyl-carrier-protein] synthase II